MDWLDKHGLRHWLADENEDYCTRTALSEPRLVDSTFLVWTIPPFHVPPEVRDSPETVVETVVQFPPFITF